MSIVNGKAQRLEFVARQYYEENKTQEEIASAMGISRPMVGRILHEARKLGIVEIRVHAADKSGNLLLSQIKKHFGILDGFILPDMGDNHVQNRALASATIKCIQQIGGGRIGIGWGHIIGTLVELFEEGIPGKSFITDISPLVGNFSVTIRNYHSNENVRIIAHYAGATPHYLHVPAFVETQQDLELLQQTEYYKSVYRAWEELDIAVVNIGNHPSTPDFATVARFGNLLAKRKVVGRLVTYYFNEKGEIISSDSDHANQIPITLLEKCPHVVGVCSANVGWRALAGALRTNLLTHVIATGSLVSEVLKSL